MSMKWSYCLPFFWVVLNQFNHIHLVLLSHTGFSHWVNCSLERKFFYPAVTSLVSILCSLFIGQLAKWPWCQYQMGLIMDNYRHFDHLCHNIINGLHLCK